MVCNLANKENVFEWYCGEPDTLDSGVTLYSFVSSSTLPALILSLWQALVMPHAFYYLALVILKQSLGLPCSQLSIRLTKIPSCTC